MAHPVPYRVNDFNYGTNKKKRTHHVDGTKRIVQGRTGTIVTYDVRTYIPKRELWHGNE